MCCLKFRRSSFLPNVPLQTSPGRLVNTSGSPNRSHDPPPHTHTLICTCGCVFRQRRHCGVEEKVRQTLVGGVVKGHTQIQRGNISVGRVEGGGGVGGVSVASWGSSGCGSSGMSPVPEQRGRRGGSRSRRLPTFEPPLFRCSHVHREPKTGHLKATRRVWSHSSPEMESVCLFYVSCKAEPSSPSQPPQLVCNVPTSVVRGPLSPCT